MTAADIFHRLKAGGVDAKAEPGGGLRLRARRGVLTPDLLAAIDAAKPELLALLADRRREQDGRQRDLDAALSAALAANDGARGTICADLADAIERTARQAHADGNFTDLTDLVTSTLPRCLANTAL